MSVYRRNKNGAFYMDYIHKGVRVYKSTGKYTKRDAKLAEAADKQRLHQEVSCAQQNKPVAVTLSKAIEQTYEAKWKTNKDAMGTYRRAQGLVEVMGDILIDSITEDTIEALICTLDVTGVQVATVNRYLATLKTILKYKKQPCDFIRLRKERKGRIRVLSHEEVQQVVRCLRNEEHLGNRPYFHDVALLVEVLVDTGCRLSEVLNLRYEDVNFESNLISIWINKGERPRSIPMTRRVRSILEGRQHGNPKPFRMMVYQAEYAWNWARNHLKLNHDKEFVMHALRHTCASRLVNKGVDLYVVKEWLGHSSIQITERYAHLNPSKLADAVEVLESETS
ncbi:site-specific integrase [Geomonas nitrogeniifigens]|uniref:tyrosine-type recombinase/integrase n=1 Tax=Geomonas diazotrophica TaxID=2843197 RepID=UPI001C2C1199|nr:site-specific integrase [Geomonas nitrogeniifigens]QXE88128.1 site-specific integrase [Geomonas nitrogeniifigens]